MTVISKSIACSLGIAMFTTIPNSGATQDIQLDWASAEIGFFDLEVETSDPLYGVAVYVLSNRLATEADLELILPEFCKNGLENLLKLAQTIEGAPEVSALKLQLDFYGPAIGENQSYVGVSGTVDVIGEQCVP